MGLGFTFFFISLFVLTPLSIVGFINAFHCKRTPQTIGIVFGAISIGLTFLTITNAFIGMVLSRSGYYDFDYNTGYIYYVEGYTHPCSRIACFIGVFAISIATFVFIFSLINRIRVNAYSPATPYKVNPYENKPAFFKFTFY